MSAARFIVGENRSVIATLPNESVDMVLSSPPYFTLRSYLAVDHPLKHAEIGQEGSPGEFLDALLALMDDLWRVLTPDGTFWINLGDTHAGSGGAGGDYDTAGLREGIPRSQGTARKARREQGYRNDEQEGGPLRGRARDEGLGIVPRRLRTRRTLPGYPLDQSVCWLPHLFGASLAYGRNLLTGEEHQQWVTRPAVTWCKPSVTPGREGRKFRTATELIIYGGKHQGHYFDLDAVREEPKLGYEINRNTLSSRTPPGQTPRAHRAGINGKRINSNEKGVPPFNWWVVNTVPYVGAHFATFPPELCVRPILAGCPVGGSVLDPFAGSGTTLAVATGHGRDAIGIDIDARNADLARERVGMFLTVEDHTPEVAS